MRLQIFWRLTMVSRRGRARMRLAGLPRNGPASPPELAPVGDALLPGALEQEVAVAPTRFLVENLVDYLQFRRVKPALYPVAPWGVVVASERALEYFAADRPGPGAAAAT